MKYIFTTLAIGENYLENSYNSFKEFSVSCSADFNITTNIIKESTNKINIDILKLDKYGEGPDYFSFYFNLKCLSLKYCLDKDYDYIVYLDSDWRIGESFDENKLMNIFTHMETNGYDFLFERPGRIGDHKSNLHNCFFQDKLKDYNAFDHNNWDDAHVVNEQFLIFKNNNKFKFFVNRWEQFLWYSIMNNIKNYAEGFEIGISALEANMSWDWNSFRGFLSECFQFNDKYGNLHTRF